MCKTIDYLTGAFEFAIVDYKRIRTRTRLICADLLLKILDKLPDKTYSVMPNERLMFFICNEEVVRILWTNRIVAVTDTGREIPVEQWPTSKLIQVTEIITARYESFTTKKSE